MCICQDIIMIYRACNANIKTNSTLSDQHLVTIEEVQL